MSSLVTDAVRAVVAEWLAGVPDAPVLPWIEGKLGHEASVLVSARRVAQDILSETVHGRRVLRYCAQMDQEHRDQGCSESAGSESWLELLLIGMSSMYQHGITLDDSPSKPIPPARRDDTLNL